MNEIGVKPKEEFWYCPTTWLTLSSTNPAGSSDMGLEEKSATWSDFNPVKKFCQFGSKMAEGSLD